MIRLVKEEKTQSLVELAIVFIIFYFFVIGIIQLTMLGHGWIKVQQIARRAAWHGNFYSNAFDSDWGSGYIIKEQLIALGSNTPETRPIKINGTKKDGFIYEVSYNVPAIGYFNIFWPKGYKTLKTKTAVIAQLNHPKVDKFAKKSQGEIIKVIKRIADQIDEMF